MTEIKTFLKKDHGVCDEHLSRVEELVSKKMWEEAKTFYKTFVKLMDLHLAREEEVLFPAIEKVTGMTSGPTAVMRSEHAQMRDLMNQMNDSLKDSQGDRFLGASETLMILIQQHNLKEEQILYPMADQVLSSQKPDIVNRIRDFALA